mgnify:FL=1
MDLHLMNQTMKSITYNLLGSGVGNNITEDFNSFKYHQSYKNVMVVKYIDDFILNLEL